MSIKLEGSFGLFFFLLVSVAVVLPPDIRTDRLDFFSYSLDWNFSTVIRVSGYAGRFGRPKISSPKMRLNRSE